MSTAILPIPQSNTFISNSSFSLPNLNLFSSISKHLIDLPNREKSTSVFDADAPDEKTQSISSRFFEVVDKEDLLNGALVAVLRLSRERLTLPLQYSLEQARLLLVTVIRDGDPTPQILESAEGYVEIHWLVGAKHVCATIYEEGEVGIAFADGPTVPRFLDVNMHELAKSSEIKEIRSFLDLMAAEIINRVAA